MKNKLLREIKQLEKELSEAFSLNISPKAGPAVESSMPEDSSTLCPFCQQPPYGDEGYDASEGGYHGETLYCEQCNEKIAVEVSNSGTRLVDPSELGSNSATAGDKLDFMDRMQEGENPFAKDEDEDSDVDSHRDWQANNWNSLEKDIHAKNNKGDVNEGENPFAKDEDDDVEECNEGENPFASDEDEEVVDHGTDGAPTSNLAERKAMEVYNKLVESAVRDESARANRKVLKDAPNLKYNQLYREYAGNRIKF